MKLSQGSMQLVIGALLGFSSVALGAYFEHGLKTKLDADSFNSLQIALRHQQLHSVVIVAIALSLLCALPESLATWLGRASIVMIFGVIIFSGSIYLTYIGGLTEFRKFAPTGGILTMLGWLLIGYAGLRARRTGN